MNLADMGAAVTDSDVPSGVTDILRCALRPDPARR
ncbi:hypothetical protein ENSA7_68460 [Enhygromyxa salina]|uniref:Uncharacterized protein n=1 Tax=Enhygromyxa salina TaxID=215803 RepID=A0A2S9XT52_9BACT|nr:hypothetical protein ENSA7_68460 [Enhygromyxa salina]